MRIYAPIGGLQPGTRNYFRVVARSDAGTTAGTTRAFSTSAGPLATTGAAQVSGTSVVLTGKRRSGRPRDGVVVRARAVHDVRHVDRPPQRGLRARRGRGLGDDRRADAGDRVPRPPRRAQLGGHDAGRRRRLPHRGPPGRGPGERLGDLAHAWLDLGADVQTSGLETRVWVELGRGGALSRRSNVVVLPAGSAGAASRSGSAGSRPEPDTPSGSSRRTSSARQPGRMRRSAPPRGRSTSAGARFAARSWGRTAPTVSSGRAAET